jgi:hypothetical protein
MALAAEGSERAIERAAPADLDHVAQRVAACRLTNNAMIRSLAFSVAQRKGFSVPLMAGPLVAGDEKTDRAFVEPCCAA